MRVATSCEAEEVFLELLEDDPACIRVSSIVQWCAECLNDIHSTSSRCCMLSSRAKHVERCSMEEEGERRSFLLCTEVVGKENELWRGMVAGVMGCPFGCRKNDDHCWRRRVC